MLIRSAFRREELDQLDVIGRQWTAGKLTWAQAVRLRDRVRAGERVVDVPRRPAPPLEREAPRTPHPAAKADWTGANWELSNEVIGRRLGVSAERVRQKRAALNIPPAYTTPFHQRRRAALLERLEELDTRDMTTVDVARHLGVSTDTARSYLRALGRSIQNGGYRSAVRRRGDARTRPHHRD